MEKSKLYFFLRDIELAWIFYTQNPHGKKQAIKFLIDSAFLLALACFLVFLALLFVDASVAHSERLQHGGVVSQCIFDFVCER